jgi:TolB-like protein
MPDSAPVVYAFGLFRLIPVEKRLLFEGKPLALAPKVFDTLVLLVENSGRLLEKDELIKRLWPDSFVEDVALAHAISQLRKELRIGADESGFIETVPKRGYRFVAPVAVVREEAVPQQPLAAKLGVLPFENLGGEGHREYLSDGLTEEVIASLGQLDPERLRVIGRTSMMAYKGARKSLAEIGRELGTDYLLESSIRTEGERQRVTSRLIRVRDQVQIWTESYDSAAGSVLELQRELSGAIARQVHLQLNPERLSALAKRQTQHREAYDLYLRGRYFWHQLSGQTTRRAVEYYTQATELDPNYALAWAGLADAFAASPINGDAPHALMATRARQAAGQAMRSGPDLAEAHNALGFVKFWIDWDWTGAVAAFERALELDASFTLARRTLAIALSHMGRHAEARPFALRAIEQDPLHAGHHALASQVACNARDFSAAVEHARRATVLDPEFWVGHLQLAQALEPMGKDDLALEALRAAWRFSGGNSKVLALRGYLLAKMGRVLEAREVLHTLEMAPEGKYLPPYAPALVYAGLNDADAAFQWLQRALEVSDVHLAFLPVDAKWDGLRSDVRFGALLERCAFTSATISQKTSKFFQGS